MVGIKVLGATIRYHTGSRGSSGSQRYCKSPFLISSWFQRPIQYLATLESLLYSSLLGRWSLDSFQALTSLRSGSASCCSRTSSGVRPMVSPSDSEGALASPRSGWPKSLNYMAGVVSCLVVLIEDGDGDCLWVVFGVLVARDPPL